MTTLNLAVGATADDAEQQQDGTVTTNTTTLGRSLDATTEWVGLRFQGVTIASGSTINTATPTVEPTATDEDEPSVTFFGEGADNAAQFTTAASSISGRTLTTASVAWSSSNLGADGNSRHAGPNLAAIVQEIVDRAGWSSGNALVLLIQGGSFGTRDLTFKSYDSSSADAATLDIDYTAPSTGQPTTKRWGGFEHSALRGPVSGMRRW